MTHRQRKAPKLSKRKAGALRGIAASLYFLHQEAARNSLPEVSNIVEQSIHALNDWMKRSSGGKVWEAWRDQKFYDKSLYCALCFLSACESYGPQEQEWIMDFIRQQEDGTPRPQHISLVKK